MKKGKMNLEDELYEDEDDYQDDDDEYYEDDYEEEEEEEKPKKKQNNKKSNTNIINNNTNKPNQKQSKNVVNQNSNSNINSNNTNLNMTKKESSISSLALSPSSSSSISVSNKESKKEEKTGLSIEELNNIKSYPTIDYGEKFTKNNNKNENPTINMVIIGHVDSGKSTMIGHLLYLLNEINKKEVHKNLKIKSNKGGEQGKETLAFANATDEASDERERGVTIDIAFKSFKTKNRNVLALDAPGHKDFIPNMIAGTSAADSALLVIDSGMNAFSSGFYGGGQTREHALLAKTLGVSQLIVAVNKLELFNWKKERFDEIVETLQKFLVEELGFDEKNIKYIPVSGLTGDNLTKPISAKGAEWYKGPTLVELIDLLEPPQRAIDSPVRFIINDVSKNPVNGYQGINLYGKLEAGIISVNSEYIILPSGNKEKIRTIAVNKKSRDYIVPGEQAELLLFTNKNAKEELTIEPGNVLCSEKYPIPCIKTFKAHIKTYELKTPISLGQKMMLYLQGQKSQICIKKIERIFNEGSKVSKTNKRFIPKNFYADIIIESEDKLCAELFSLNKKLSTFALRINCETQAIGYITQFLE